MGIQVNKSKLSAIFGISERTFTEYQKVGMPIGVTRRRRGAAHEYDTEAVFNWLLEHRIAQLTESDGEIFDLNAERARLAREQADSMALKNAVAKRELAPVSLLESALAQLAQQVISILDSIPLKVKKRSPKLTARDIEDIRREIVKAQNAASSANINYSELEGGA